MTRPVKSSQLDELSGTLTDVAALIADGGSGRVSLSRMKDHANARGLPAGTLGGGSASTCSCDPDHPCPHGTSTERAALNADPTIGDYDRAVTILARMLGDARQLALLLARYNRTAGNVCPRCSIDIPKTQVRCRRCMLAPDTQTCANPTCDYVFGERDTPRNGYCSACYEFRRRNKRLPTADDRRPRKVKVYE